MARIQIITDSTADIPEEVRERLGIEVVPLKVHFANDTYYDGVTIHTTQFYQMLAQAAELPTTSQPSPVEFMEVYKRIGDQPDTIMLSLHIASVLSGTYQSAVLAKSLLEDRMKVTIVDSRTTSYGLGMLVVAAAEAAQAGKNLDEIIALVEQLRKETRLYFVLDTLEYLYKGGRIGKASVMLGSLLNIKPILTVDDVGEVDSVDRVRGHKKALLRIIELLKEDFAGKTIDICIAHSEAQASAELLYELIKEQFKVNRHSYTNLGPVIGTHVGPGGVAVFANPVV